MGAPIRSDLGVHARLASIGNCPGHRLLAASPKWVGQILEPRLVGLRGGVDEHDDVPARGSNSDVALVWNRYFDSRRGYEVDPTHPWVARLDVGEPATRRVHHDDLSGLVERL